MYKTKQKDILLNFFKANSDKCFTSRDIIENDKISLGEATVYRLLSLFVKEGKVKKFVNDKAGSFYQYNHCSSFAHFHMKCMACGELYHIDYPPLKQVEEGIEKDYSFVVDNTNTTLYGYCKDCRKES